uniref:Putative secreted peptide n=1 Tax=Anopheles braziliensis TaxID=58242 RepID=A0A2M3ZQE3_9DIPT
MFRLRSVLAFTGFALLRCVIPPLTRVWFEWKKCNARMDTKRTKAVECASVSVQTSAPPSTRLPEPLSARGWTDGLVEAADTCGSGCVCARARQYSAA